MRCYRTQGVGGGGGGLTSVLDVQYLLFLLKKLDFENWPI